MWKANSIFVKGQSLGDLSFQIVHILRLNHVLFERDRHLLSLTFKRLNLALQLVEYEGKWSG